MTTETHVAKIMGAERAFALNSGMGALDAITRLVRSGDEIIAGDDIYGGTF
jgi:cysteine-S-conjugate beta-lyase